MAQHVLKDNELMMVSDERGDMPRGRRRLGLYYCDTRYLSILETSIDGQRPRLLASSSEENYMCDIQMANPTLRLSDSNTALARTISIRRRRFLKDGLEERVEVLDLGLAVLALDVVVDDAGLDRGRAVERGDGDEVFDQEPSHAPVPQVRLQVPELREAEVVRLLADAFFP